MRHISILGSTGSIGTQTLDVVREHGDIKRETFLSGLEQQRCDKRADKGVTVRYASRWDNTVK